MEIKKKNKIGCEKMIWSIDLNVLTIWYYVLIAIILIVCLYGTLEHDSFIPLMWGAFMSCVLYVGATTLEPLIFGYQYYEMYSIPWFLVSAFGILFGLIMVQTLYNVAKYGTVIE